MGSLVKERKPKRVGAFVAVTELDQRFGCLHPSSSSARSTSRNLLAEDDGHSRGCAAGYEFVPEIVKNRQVTNLIQRRLELFGIERSAVDRASLEFP